jgi:hypothetical protein
MARYGATPQSLRQFSYFAISAVAVATASALVIAPLAYGLSNEPVDRGLTSSFAVLAGTGITSTTTATTVSGSAGGNLGSAPTASFTNSSYVTTNGTKYTAPDTVVDNAKTALISVYNDVAGRAPVTETITANLGGRTLITGVYADADILELTGTLTLDGQNNPNAVFIFQAGSALVTTGVNNVVLIGGAQACNVFWQVTSSASFDTNSNFVGHVLALESITAASGADFNGSLQARNGTVTLDNNTIINDLCDEDEVTPGGGGNSLSDTGASTDLVTIVGGLAAVLAVAGVTYAVRRRRSI